MKRIRKDLMGAEPKERDLIVYNPPYHKGLEVGVVVGFSSTGLPIIVRRTNIQDFDEKVNSGELAPSSYTRYWGCNTPRTGFVVIKEEQNETDKE